MKKTIGLLAILMAFSMSVYGQSSDIKNKKMSVDIEFSTKKPKVYRDVSLDFVYKYFVIGGSYGWQSDNSDKEGEKKKNTQKLDVHLGGNYRYFIGGDRFFIEGRLLAGYYCNSQKKQVGTRTETHYSGFGRITEKKVEKSEIWKNVRGEDGFYLSLMPRVGCRVVDNFMVYAGAGWKFLNSDTKFKNVKFDDKFDAYFFTVGVAMAF